ncbi:hypothetical protein RFI_16218 [Reticulomyxa filosa]|uniref:Uncharacterized protein n=1 Tax=Reticulomyxa filosa TaxID=46433 RepID=X6N4Z1_RETFI|nr:hypothetical protein RFI_16218 [Reticulomyxa filosa]|eukprot:ETO20983.1 hypothetical protein RFI_16218 [Reticulomyxa filosa]
MSMYILHLFVTKLLVFVFESLTLFAWIFFLFRKGEKKRDCKKKKKKEDVMHIVESSEVSVNEGNGLNLSAIGRDVDNELQDALDQGATENSNKTEPSFDCKNKTTQKRSRQKMECEVTSSCNSKSQANLGIFNCVITFNKSNNKKVFVVVCLTSGTTPKENKIEPTKNNSKVRNVEPVLFIKKYGEGGKGKQTLMFCE